LTQNILARPTLSQALLSFNIPNIDNLFPGFATGDFAILHGLPTILPLSLLLCVRAQLPIQLGGLETNVVFVDGGNTFRLYKVSHIAQLHQLNPRQVLERIYISRAFTAHQMTSIILDKLEEAVLKHHAKFVIISDFAGLYLDKDIPAEESREVFSQVTAYLSKFTKENDLITVATCIPHGYSRRDVFFHAVACARSNVVVRVARKTVHPFGQQFILEKHPTLKTGLVDFPSENLTLNDFSKGGG
jgi:hypothetical protein